LADRVGQVLRQQAQAGIRLGRRPFLQADGAGQDGWEALMADGEEAPGALGLRAPEAIRGDLDGAEAVGFDARVHAALKRGRASPFHGRFGDRDDQSL
jgi:hypothetical protein